MPNENKILWVLQSRKFWAACVGLVAIFYTAWQSGGGVDPDTLVNAILGIVAAFIGATAIEDGLTNRNATTTTVSTPGTSDVTVTPSDTSTPPAQTVMNMYADAGKLDDSADTVVGKELLARSPVGRTGLR